MGSWGRSKLAAWVLVTWCAWPSAWAQKPPDGLTHTCARIARDRTFNETIEKMCGFKGDVSERFKDAFKKRKCTSKVNPAEDERITREVIAQIMAQKNDVGLKDFCLMHRSAYHNL
jgi:hypothetical protein